MTASPSVGVRIKETLVQWSGATVLTIELPNRYLLRRFSRLRRRQDRRARDGGDAVCDGGGGRPRARNVGRQTRQRHDVEGNPEQMTAEEQLKGLRAEIARLQDAGQQALALIDLRREVTNKLLAVADELAEENQRLRSELNALKRQGSAARADRPEEKRATGETNGNF
jgi:hypothetical protein